MESYASQCTDVSTLSREAFYLYRSHSKQIPETVKCVLTELADLENLTQRYYSFALKDRDVLDVGAGQFLPQGYYLAQSNRVTGIDLDVIARGLNPTQYLTMLCVNGPRRTAKTIIRKGLGIDRQYRAELKTQMNVRKLPKLRVLRMSACELRFRDLSFDFVHSFSVFHSLPNPGAAIDEIKRVLRPGGIAYISLHLYTSQSGSLDPRSFANGRQPALWPHLRPQFADSVKPNAYLNKLRLDEWRDIFDRRMPRARLLMTPAAQPNLEWEAAALQANGELRDYSIEELVTHRIRVLWQKS